MGTETVEELLALLNEAFAEVRDFTDLEVARTAILKAEQILMDYR